MKLTKVCSIAIVASVMGLPFIEAKADILALETVFTTFPPGSGEMVVKNLTTGTSFWAWCLQADEAFVDGLSYTASQLTSDTLFTAIQKTQIDRLFSRSYESTSAFGTPVYAFQLALWEIVHDQPLAGPNFMATGQFPANFPSGQGWDSQTLALANSMLTNLSAVSPSPYQIVVWRSPASQDVITVSQVPEPSAPLLFAGGLSLLLLRNILRNQSSTRQKV